MRQPICSVYDKLTNLYELPFVARHTGEAIREFADVKKQEGNKFSKNPDDFQLRHLGYFDFETGEFEILQKPVFLES